MRLIDAHDLMERLYDANPKGRVELAELIKTEPTVDALEVVRCKDCIHYYADPWGYGNCVFEGGVSRRTKTSDFCSWGERRKNR